MNYRNLSLCALLCVFSQLPSAASLYDGIWQDEIFPAKFYTIHSKGDTIILVDMSKVEKTGKTLNGTYLGSAPIFQADGLVYFKKLDAVAPLNTVEDGRDLVFTPDGKKAVSSFNCQACSNFGTFMKKVFPVE